MPKGFQSAVLSGWNWVTLATASTFTAVDAIVVPGLFESFSLQMDAYIRRIIEAQADTLFGLRTGFLKDAFFL